MHAADIRRTDPAVWERAAAEISKQGGSNG